MKLNDLEILTKLKEMKGWEYDGKSINKTFVFSGFDHVMVFTNEIARRTKEIGHHPDMQVMYNKVKISIATANEQGVTNKDFELANAIEAISQ
ncbi:4a-hydroxytetrahydrobiopterin dehydratase [Nanoarchaeota archaeon]